MTELDVLFINTGTGDREAFADWMGRVERPIHASLARFARAVDVEGVVQETLMSMWIYSRENAGRLEGENASLRFAIGMARNIARSEARRNGRLAFLPPEDLPDTPLAPEPVRDARLAQFIRECFEALAEQPRRALGLRVNRGAIRHDRELAERLGMTLNTFLQNIVRARAQMLDCLTRKKVPLEELGI